MPEAQHDLGAVSQVRAEAIGRPGQRRFRVLAEGPAGSAMIWLEKEELRNLALAIARLLEVVGDQAPRRRAGQPPRPGPPRGGTPVQFQARSWTVGYDEEKDAFDFLARAEEETAQATLHFQATREQGRALSEEALKVYAAGRPVCALCGSPLDPGTAHSCPRANGHIDL